MQKSIRRIVSYDSALKEIDTNRSRDDIFWRGQKPRFQIISYRDRVTTYTIGFGVENKNESYGEFLRRNPTATKKQRIIAIQRFYNNLLK